MIRQDRPKIVQESTGTGYWDTVTTKAVHSDGTVQVLLVTYVNGDSFVDRLDVRQLQIYRNRWKGTCQ